MLRHGRFKLLELVNDSLLKLYKCGDTCSPVTSSLLLWLPQSIKKHTDTDMKRWASVNKSHSSLFLMSSRGELQLLVTDYCS